MKTNFKLSVPALVLGFAFQAAFAGNITDINVSVLPDQRRVIKVKFDRDITKPSGFIYSSPARIALDFPATKVQLAQKQLSYNDSLLNHIVAAEDSERARISLSLSKEGQYDTEIKGDEVWVYVSESSGSSAPVAQNGPVADGGRVTAPAAAGEAPFNINFRVGGNKTAIIDYSSAYTGQPQVKVQNDRVVITLKNYPLATQDQKNLDVTAFSTPVRNVTVRRLGNDTQVTIRNQGAWEHKVKQSNGRQEIRIVPVSRVLADAGFKDKRSTKQKFSGKRISLDFQDVDVRTILQILAKESGMNIVAADSVQGKMTLTLKDVPWDQALHLILDTYDLDKAEQGNIIRIAPRLELEARAEEILKKQKEQQDLEPLYTRTFQLKYKNVDEFQETLRLSEGSRDETGRGIHTKRGQTLTDKASNTLIVTDIQSVIKKFEKLIEELDVPSRQVMVEARIVEASEGVERDLGVKFGYGRRGATAWGADLKTAGDNRNAALDNTSTFLAPNVNLPRAAAINSIALVRSVASGALGLELSALEKDNRAKTISSPRVLTQDRKEAEIKQGFQIPYQSRDKDGGTVTAFKDAVLSLKVTPRITPDSKVILDIAINKDDVERGLVNANGEPAITTKQVTTQAMIEDGGTLVVGGIYQETMAHVVNKVPVLGDLPVVGNLFKSNGRNHSRNELLFFITPRIMGGESNVMR